jgi:hypothetical protein
MSIAGRPIRFLGTVVTGWTAARVWLLWPTITTVPALLHAVVPGIAPARRTVVAAATEPAGPVARRLVAAGPAARGVVTGLTRPVPDPVPGGPAPLPPAHRPPDPRRIAIALAALTRYGTPVPVETATDPAHRSRLSGSAWLLLRGAGPAGVAPGGQLGGAQGGVRLSYALDAARRLSLNGRFSAPLHGSGREIALGLAWQPVHAPVTLLAEARLPIDGGRPAPAVSAIGGFNPAPVAAGFRLEGYGQAGAIKRERVDAFADGYLRLAHPIVAGAVAIDLGAGAWGGAQPGASRLDVGPSLGVTLPPVAGHRLRATLDWRQRIAGQARPGSGLALALGADF